MHATPHVVGDRQEADLLTYVLTPDREAVLREKFAKGDAGDLLPIAKREVDALFAEIDRLRKLVVPSGPPPRG